MAQGVFAQKSVAPLVAWRPRSRSWWWTSEVDHADLDGCGDASPGRDTNAWRRCAASAATAGRARYRHDLEKIWFHKFNNELRVALQELPHHAILRLVGRDPAEYLMNNLTEQRYSFTATAEREIARDVTEKLCYIGVDYDTKLEPTVEIDMEKTCELLDGNIITVGVKRLHGTEVLFQPSFTGESQRSPRHLFSEQ